MNAQTEAKVDRELDEGLQLGEVIAFTGKQQGIRPDSSLEDHASFHRKAAAAYLERAAEARREGKAELARIAAEEKAAREAWDKERARCADLRALTKADTAKRVSEALTKAAGARANCDVIEKRL